MCNSFSKNLQYILFILFFTVSLTGLAVDEEDDEANLSSPYHTVVTHLKFLQENNYKPNKSALTVLQKGISEKEAIEIAIKLKQIFDGKGLYISVDEIPQNPDYIDTVKSQSYKYVISDDIPDIYLVKLGNSWIYSKKSVNEVNRLHKEVYPYGTDRLLSMLPKLGTRTYFGLHLWQLIGVLILISFSVVSYYAFSFVVKSVFRRMAKKEYKDLTNLQLAPIGKSFSLFFVFLLLVVFVPVLQLPIKVSQYLILALKAALPFFVTITFYKLVDVLAFYLEKLVKADKTSLDDQLIPLLRKILKIFVVVVGALFIMQNLRINITALLAGISITGLAFALAAQDMIKNFFGSIMVFLDKPFKKGDWITSGNIDGTVEEVGFRSTRIRTFTNSLVYVPNGKLADATIDNHGLRMHRRFYTKIPIKKDTSTVLIELFIERLRKIVQNHPKTRKDFFQIHLNELSDYKLEIMFYIFFTVPTWDEELKCRHEVLLEIVNLAKELDIPFAYPTQTVHLKERFSYSK